MTAPHRTRLDWRRDPPTNTWWADTPIGPYRTVYSGGQYVTVFRGGIVARNPDRAAALAAGDTDYDQRTQQPTPARSATVPVADLRAALTTELAAAGRVDSALTEAEAVEVQAAVYRIADAVGIDPTTLKGS